MSDTTKPGVGLSSASLGCAAATGGRGHQGRVPGTGWPSRVTSSCRGTSGCVSTQPAISSCPWTCSPTAGQSSRPWNCVGNDSFVLMLLPCDGSGGPGPGSPVGGGKGQYGAAQ